MLKFLRNKHNQKKIYIVLAIAIIPPFLFWGVSTSQKESKIPSTLGMIDNKKISLKQYLNSYKAVQHQMALMYGEKIKEVASMINYKGEAWDRLLLLHYAEQEKIKTTDTEVVQWLMAQPLFQSRGQFNDNIYKLYVNNYLRSNPRDFEEEVRGLLTIDKIVGQIRSKIVVKDEELKTLYNQEQTKNGGVVDDKKFESEKEAFKTKVIQEKTSDEMKKLLDSLRNKLKIDLETMKKIFASEEKPS